MKFSHLTIPSVLAHSEFFRCIGGCDGSPACFAQATIQSRGSHSLQPEVTIIGLGAYAAAV